MNLRFLALLPIVAAGLAVPPVAVTAGIDPMVVRQCSVTPPKAHSTKASGTQITFQNFGTQAVARVTFEVDYNTPEGMLSREVTENGPFAVGATVSRHFSAYDDVTFAGKSARCTATSITWKH